MGLTFFFANCHCPLHVGAALSNASTTCCHTLPQPSEKEFLGYVPIMLRCSFCVLSERSDRELMELGECIYDQGGYFVINGRSVAKALRL
jgi:DNA-directed RNA polymerase beta subunit